MSQEEYNDNADDHEEGVEMEEECKDSSGWRVLRKRKIALALPNGLSNSDEESAASEPSSQPVAHPPSQPSRVTSCQVSTQTVSPIPTLARSIPAVSKESVAKVSIPHILARNSTSATLTTVTPSSTTWIRPFTRVQLDHPKRSTEYHKRQAEQAKRPTKVRSLLEAGYTTFTEPSRPSTPQSTQAAPVTESVPETLVPETQSFPLASDMIMEDICKQDQEQRSSQKSVLVPAVDNSGQEILLHVEYTTLDEASLGNNLQSLPLPTVPPVGPSYSTTMPAPDFTGALSGMQNMSASSTVIQNLQMAPPVVQNVPVVQSLMQTLPVSTSTMNIPAMSSFVQTLASSAEETSLVQTSPVTASTSGNPSGNIADADSSCVVACCATKCYLACITAESPA
ncbi:hypothetical protein HPB51_010616 [Rhipicephalus microplus]|uniref:Uncharacterized protein n=1 Tax=Rhipicephalus microplus TaxID=6941 RepID=A0A9J6EPB7_RHIMP|nr:hypothetical protein HPB51_010616 [Rhipicephalus microplus]